MRTSPSFLLVIPAFFPLVSASGSGYYTATDIGTLGGTTVPFAINSSGKVAGSSEQFGIARAVLYTSGSIQYLGNLGGNGADAASAINDSDQVVGASRIWTGLSH